MPPSTDTADDDTVVVSDSVRTSLESEKWYSLDSAEEEFFMTQTGIQDPAELKKHILAVQAKACEVCHERHVNTSAKPIISYPGPLMRCVLVGRVCSLKIARLPAYGKLLKVGKERKGALFLDIGCCLGNDVRKVVVDGFPMNQVFASDLRPGTCHQQFITVIPKDGQLALIAFAEFWQLGHKLFRSTPNTFPVPFISGDVFDPAFLPPAEIPTTARTVSLPPLSDLTSLARLAGHLSVIHASSFFQLFDGQLQLQLAKRLAALLSPEPGSFIFGSHAGRPEKSVRMEAVPQDFRGTRMWCYCPESWTELWECVFGGKGIVKVEAELKEIMKENLMFDAMEDEATETFYQLTWSVTRI
ncbi:hypothetical protein PHLCEN_2v1014 [Hermanssonia centrifuga]|uniref:Uncharacterized protein n=1 Tax=Hermanssonia centrifuga TaxID=98765 RepID=A0A2R6S4D2_9APHY|nr:hypothetical protein PHLCEN_2v1014 [Hermanssonia centrifuga]